MGVIYRGSILPFSPPPSLPLLCGLPHTQTHKVFVRMGKGGRGEEKRGKEVMLARDMSYLLVARSQWGKGRGRGRGGESSKGDKRTAMTKSGCGAKNRLFGERLVGLVRLVL